MIPKGPPQYDVPFEEQVKIKKRAALRAALKKEYIKKLTDPHRHGTEEGYVFDPAVQRFMSMRATIFQQFKPTTKGFMIWAGTVLLPIIGYGYILTKSKQEFEAKCRRGEIPYAERRFKQLQYR